MKATYRLSPRTALTVENEQGHAVVYLSHLPTAHIVVAPSPGAEIILGALGRAPSSAHPDAQSYLGQLTDRGLLVRNDHPVEELTASERVLVSAVGTSPWLGAPLPPGWRVVRRPVEAGSKATVSRRRLQTCWQLMRRSRRYDVVVLSAAAYETLILAVLRPFVTSAVVIHDPLLPTSATARRLLEFMATSFDAVWCIRPADLTAWRRARSSTFMPFFSSPVSTGAVAAATTTPSVYSGGTAHRNFTTVIDAARVLGVATTIGTTQPLPALPVNVERVVPGTTAEGRLMQEQAGISVFVLQPTVLPAGPTVLLDAMSVGAAIVCNDAAGHRDYVSDGVDALVVPTVPATDDLVRAIKRLMADPQLRVRLGSAARERAEGLRPSALMPRYVAETERVIAEARSRKGRVRAALHRNARRWQQEPTT